MSFSTLTRAGLLLTGLLASSFSTLSLAEGTIRLNFGVYSSNRPSSMVRVYRPILKELEKSMTRRLNRNVDIRMQIAKDYDQGISHLVTGRIDFSKFGPASYLEAVRMDSDISILAIENVNNSKVFQGIIAVAEDSTIASLGELQGKSFAFGDESSTIGRFLSQLELEQAGIRAGDLSGYEYLGRHDKVGSAVGAGKFDAGALNEKTFKKLVAAGEPIRELARFPSVSKPWIARSGLDEEIFQALRESLLEVRNPETLAALKIDGFLEGSDDDYKVIRKAMNDNHVFFANPETALARDDTVTDAVPDLNKEPDLQAAVTDRQTPVDLSDAVTIQHSAIVHDASAQGTRHHLTLNISLPHSLYEANRNGHALTINLNIPENAIDDTALQPAGR